MLHVTSDVMNNNEMCEIMYKIRDAINEANLDKALIMSEALVMSINARIIAKDAREILKCGGCCE